MKAFYWAFLLIFTASSLANTIDTDLQELEKNLGSYPPAIENEAQRGLFFAYYYQGKVALAYKQALILKNSWPENGYEKLIDMTASVLKRNNEITPNYQADKLAHTSCEKPDSTT